MEKVAVEPDDSFLVDKGARREMPVRSCIHVIIGMASSFVVPQKGVGDSPIAEERTLVMPCKAHDRWTRRRPAAHKLEDRLPT